jgi:tetratricopeptide (TPR) repeat protein
LVAARRGDSKSLAASYEGLATSIQAAGNAPETAAALHLRASAIAAAGGDLELANQRVAAARLAAPDDTSALLVVAESNAAPPIGNAETKEPGGVDWSAPGSGGAVGAEQARAIDALLARAEVLDLRSALADDPAARASWELDRAEALELAGRLREAGGVVAAVLKTQPDDLRALSALRRMTARAGDKPTWARASYQLARIIGDRAAKLALLRDAASVFDPATRGAPGASAEFAVAAYRRLLAIEPGAPELEKLLAVLRERADIRGLTAALTDRLTWLEAEQPDGVQAQMVPLLLERATVLHGLGDYRAAMADLDALLERASPNNVEALRFRADLALNAGDVPHAIELWRRYLAVETRPQRKAEVELQLAGVLAENVNDLAGAIEQLSSVLAANPDDLQLHERVLGLANRASDWPRAARALEALARLRSSPADKARDELRLGLMQRDKLNDRAAAKKTLERARKLDPINLDVVRELSELLEGAARSTMLAEAAASVRASIAAGPGRTPLYERLAQVTGWQSDVDARWSALVAVEALGTPSADQRQVITQGRQRVITPGRTKLDDAARAQLRGPLGGALAELWRAIAPSVQQATGVDPGKLGFARGDKIAIKKLGDKYEALATALAVFGVDDVEIYVSAARPGIARTLAGDTPTIVLGADVAAGSTPEGRFQLGRTIATVAEGMSTLPALRDSEVAWTIAAALRASEAPVPAALVEATADEEKSIAERAKSLKLGRKQRGIAQQLAQARGAELADVNAFRLAAVGVGYRAGLLWCGDLAVALAQLDVGKGGRTLTDSPAALELVGWSVSQDHGVLRERLGVSLKGTRA